MASGSPAITVRVRFDREYQALVAFEFALREIVERAEPWGGGEAQEIASTVLDAFRDVTTGGKHG